MELICHLGGAAVTEALCAPVSGVPRRPILRSPCTRGPSAPGPRSTAGRVYDLLRGCSEFSTSSCWWQPQVWTHRDLLCGGILEQTFLSTSNGAYLLANVILWSRVPEIEGALLCVQETDRQRAVCAPRRVPGWSRCCPNGRRGAGASDHCQCRPGETGHSCH